MWVASERQVRMGKCTVAKTNTADKAIFLKAKFIEENLDISFHF